MATRKSSKLKLWIRRRKKARAKAIAAGTAKHIKTMDVILVIIAVVLVAFTVEMVLIFRETGMIPDTLVTCVFAALGGECGAMAWIKTAKERNKDRKWQKEDQAYMEAMEREAKKQEDKYGTYGNYERTENMELPKE